MTFSSSSYLAEPFFLRRLPRLFQNTQDYYHAQSHGSILTVFGRVEGAGRWFLALVVRSFVFHLVHFKGSF